MSPTGLLALLLFLRFGFGLSAPAPPPVIDDAFGAPPPTLTRRHRLSGRGLRSEERLRDEHSFHSREFEGKRDRREYRRPAYESEERWRGRGRKIGYRSHIADAPQVLQAAPEIAPPAEVPLGPSQPGQPGNPQPVNPPPVNPPQPNNNVTPPPTSVQGQGVYRDSNGNVVAPPAQNFVVNQPANSNGASATVTGNVAPYPPPIPLNAGDPRLMVTGQFNQTPQQQPYVAGQANQQLNNNVYEAPFYHDDWDAPHELLYERYDRRFAPYNPPRRGRRNRRGRRDSDSFEN